MEGQTGGLIAAASSSAAFPLMKLGAIPVIKRIVLSFQQAGISPIVVVTGVQEESVKCELADYGVIFLHNPHYERPPLLESVQIGLNYLRGKCGRVIFTPVNVPLFSPETLLKLMESDGEIVTPSYRHHGGHPILLAAGVFEKILDYCGPDGLRGAIAGMGERRRWVEVDDPGILHSVHDRESLEQSLESHNRAISHPFVRVSIERESSFFNARAKLLLLLISETHSVREACGRMALSYSNAWKMLNTLEEALGYPVVLRRHGGKKGGRTELTERGRRFLETYEHFEKLVRAYAQEQFIRLFQDTGLL